MYSADIVKALGKAKVGDRISLTSGSRKYEGIMMPPRNPGFIVLKLDNGYNIGVRLEKKSKIERLGQGKPSSPKAPKARHDPLSAF